MSSMPWSPRRKAALFSGFLLLASLGFLVTAAADTNSQLSPFLRGHEFPDERPLSRHEVVLAVHVGSLQGDEVERVEGATVSIYSISDGSEELVKEKSTDEKGRALFHLKPGAYRAQVDWEGYSASQSGRLRESQRVGVVFDEEGTAFWRLPTPHGQLERKGDFGGLIVRVGEKTNRTDRPVPVEGATVTVYEANDNGARGDEVASATTGPRGGAAFDLPKGRYVVEVSWEGMAGSASIELRHGAQLFFLADGDSIDQVRPPHDGEHGRPKDHHRSP